MRLGNTTGAGFHQPMMSGGYFVSLIILRMIMNVLKISRDMNILGVISRRRQVFEVDQRTHGKL